MKGIIVVFLLLLAAVFIFLIGVLVYRTGINYRKKKKDLLNNRSQENKEVS